MRISTAFIASAFFLISPTGARGDLNARARLWLEEKDVTATHPDACVRFAPRGENRANPIHEIACGVTEVCIVPPGVYDVEVESPHLILETRPVVRVDEHEPLPLVLDLHMVPAAYLTVPGGRVPVGGSLRALDERLGIVYSRIVPGNVASIRVPPRPMVLCGFDKESRCVGCVRALGKVGEDSKVDLPRPNRGRGQLFAGFAYPSEDANHDLSVALRKGDATLAPDVVVTGARGYYYALWLDAPAGPATLHLSSKSWTAADPVGIDVPERGIAYKWGMRLARRPSLEVSLIGSTERLGEGDVDIALFKCDLGVLDLQRPPPLTPPFCEPAATRKGEVTSTFSFPDLEPGMYALRWRKPPLSSTKWVDLRDGRSMTERIVVEVIEIQGRVTTRGAAHPVQMWWVAANTGAQIQTKTDEDGRYTVALSQAGHYGVTLRDESGIRTLQGYDVVENAHQDFEIPGNRVKVRVESEDGAPIPGAVIAYETTGPPPSRKRRDFGGPFVADAEGKSSLPPLGNGTLTVDARADGFGPGSSSPLEVDEKTESPTVTVRLRRGAGIRFTILNPQGAPATGALIRSRNFGMAEANGDGLAKYEVPLTAGDPLIAFDRQGSMWFGRFQGEQEQTIRIPVSGPPIRVRFLTPDGKPLFGKQVALGFDGVIDDKRVSPQILWAGGDLNSGEDGRLRNAGIPGAGSLTIYPWGRPDLAVTRVLPMRDEELVFTLPFEPGSKGSK